MSDVTPLPPEVREELIRRAWYIHDARWFSAVAAEFGIEAANRLNRKAVRAVGEAEAGRLARALGTPPPATLAEVLGAIERGRDLYAPASLIDIACTPHSDDSYVAHVTSCFVAENVMRAGIAETYECAVFDRVEGWHAALRMPIAEAPLPAARCAIAHGQQCLRTFTLKKEKN